jgi:hypothetical protein
MSNCVYILLGHSVYNFKVLNNENFTAKILLSNETTFRLSGTVRDTSLEFGSNYPLYVTSYGGYFCGWLLCRIRTKIIRAFPLS